jgi:dTMP kinase
VNDQHQGEQPRGIPDGIPMIAPERSCLIVLEGIDLSGRTTQVQLLRDWLLAQHYSVTTTGWRTSPLISDILTRAGTALRPLTYSLLFSADHLDRTQQVIKPALARGEIVLADRYIYTAFARDTARGIDPAWVHNLYRYSVQPDIVFYLHISPEEAVKRRLALQQRSNILSSQKEQPSTKKGKGDDKQEHKHGKPVAPSALTTSSPSLTKEALESFRKFEMNIYNAYQQMQRDFGFTVIEGNQPINQVQATLRRAVMHRLLEV